MCFQERFLLTESNSTEDQVWWIPITIQTQSRGEINNSAPLFWLGTKNLTVNMNIKDEWFILNVRQTAFYRVNYDGQTRSRIFSALKSENFGGIHPINRAQIIDDSLNLARAEKMDYAVALLSTRYLKNELNHLPWKAFFNAIAFLNDRLSGREVHVRFQWYTLELLEKVYQKLGFYENHDESMLDKLNRELILTWACKYSHDACVIRARNLFAEWRVDPTRTIPVDAKNAVYCTALKYGDYEDWRFLWEQYLSANLESEKVTILNSLGCI